MNWKAKVAIILSLLAFLGGLAFNLWIALRVDPITAQEKRGAYLQGQLFQLHPVKRSDVTCFVLDLPVPQGGPSMSCVD